MGSRRLPRGVARSRQNAWDRGEFFTLVHVSADRAAVEDSFLLPAFDWRRSRRFRTR